MRPHAHDERPSVRSSALRALRAEPVVSDLAPAERRKQLKAQPAPPRTAPPLEAAGELPEPAFVPIADIERELRSSLRGRTEAELAVGLGAPEAAVARAVSGGLAEGRLVRRGQKLYVG